MSTRRYTLPYQNRYCRDTAPYVKVYKPPICKNRRHARCCCSNIAAREIRADRQAVQRRTPVPVRFEFRLVPLLLWRVLERRGAAEPLVYSSTHHSAIKISIRIMSLTNYGVLFIMYYANMCEFSTYINVRGVI